MITTRGAGFLAAAVALFFLARLTQVGWVYLLDSVLWEALLLSAVMPWLTTLFLAAQRSLPVFPAPRLGQATAARSISKSPCETGCSGPGSCSTWTTGALPPSRNGYGYSWPS